jgi:hypothetical protein
MLANGKENTGADLSNSFQLPLLAQRDIESIQLRKLGSVADG